jgi:protein gp37
MTSIEWTEKTWNPIAGCSVVSPGCTNCYAMKQAPRLAANPATPQYAGTVQNSKGGPVWTGKIGIASDSVLTQPLHRKKPTMYFVNSMSDLFHENVPDEVIDRIFAVMTLCHQHTFQVLTKRADRMREYFSQDEGFGRWGYIEHQARHLVDIPVGKTLANYGFKNLPNVWLGVSVEDQTRADERIPLLLDTPAAVRFISAEPLLGAVDISYWLRRFNHQEMGLHDDPMAAALLNQGIEDGNAFAQPALHWVIVGGESGHNARPMHPDWARSLRDQCVAADVPYFFKQWGSWLPGEFGTAPDVSFQNGDWMDCNTLPDIDVDNVWCKYWATHEYEGDAVFHRVGKKAAGRLLDGRVWDEMPGDKTG